MPATADTPLRTSPPPRRPACGVPASGDDAAEILGERRRRRRQSRGVAGSAPATCLPARRTTSGPSSAPPVSRCPEGTSARRHREPTEIAAAGCSAPISTRLASIVSTPIWSSTQAGYCSPFSLATRCLTCRSVAAVKGARRVLRGRRSRAQIDRVGRRLHIVDRQRVEAAVGLLAGGRDAHRDGHDCRSRGSRRFPFRDPHRPPQAAPRAGPHPVRHSSNARPAHASFISSNILEQLVMRLLTRGTLLSCLACGISPQSCFLLLPALRPAQDRSQARSMVISQRGIAATSQTLASQVGAQVLARGGSAMDAAIAANATLGVVEPESCGMGGDLFAIYWDAKTGKLTAINASGWAPRRSPSSRSRNSGTRRCRRKASCR